MQSQALAEVTTENAFSMVELLMSADPVVKAVLIALVIASIWSWAVVAEKLFAIGGARKKADEFEEAFWNGAYFFHRYGLLSFLYCGLSFAQFAGSVFVGIVFVYWGVSWSLHVIVERSRCVVVFYGGLGDKSDLHGRCVVFS